MKIVELTASVSRKAGGLFVSVRQLSQHLAKLDVQVTVLGLEDIYTEADRALWSPLEIQAFRVPFFPRFGYAPAMRRALALLQPDLVHVHGLWRYPSLLARRWSQRHHRPYVVSPRGMLEPWAWQHRAWKKRPVWWAWEKSNVQKANLLHATSEEEARNLRHLGIRRPIALIPNGVDLPEWREPVTPGDRLRTVLFLSRIHPVKGLINLVEAWRQTRPQGWQVVIAGPDDGGHQTEVASTVRAAGLDGEFVFVGPVNQAQKWDIYRRADIFVLPTFSENFGLVIAEALACGVPVITTKSAPWKVLEQARCGWWIDVGVSPLVAALREAISLSDVERREMGVRGRKLVEAHFSWPKIAADVKSVYEWILGGDVLGGDVPECVEMETNTR